MYVPDKSPSRLNPILRQKGKAAVVDCTVKISYFLGKKARRLLNANFPFLFPLSSW